MTNAELVTSTNGEYVAEILPHSTTWMIGDIHKGSRQTTEDICLAATRAMDSIEPITKSDGSTCTDGRVRLGLIGLDGQQGVAPQAVGGALMTSFAAAEELGLRFYPEYVAEDTSRRRLQYVANFLIRGGFTIGRHVNCGGVNAFPAIQQNGLRFALAGEPYVDRLGMLVPESIAEQKTRIPDIAVNAARRVSSGLYNDYTSDVVEQAVYRTARLARKWPIVEQLEDDDRGVHGHRESLIVNLAWDLGGVAINPNTLNARYDSQAFGVNGELLNRIALAFHEDSGREEDFVTAWFAMKHFTGSAHGTLGSGLATALVRHS